MVADAYTPRAQQPDEPGLAATSEQLVQAIVRLDHPDAWAYAEVGQGCPGPTFLWHTPDGRTVACFGVAASACSPLSEQVVPAIPGAPPRVFLVGGFTFDARTAEAKDSPWSGWRERAMWLPRVVIHGDEAGCEAVVTAPEPDLTRWVEWVERMDRLRRPVDPPAPRTGHYTLDTVGERRAWTERVTALMDIMGSPEAPFSKVVLARAQQLEAAPGHRFDALGTARHLRVQQPDCVTFAWWGPGERVFLGATPEVLCRVTDGDLDTVALAGTTPRGRTDEEDRLLGLSLTETAKERHEHALVVEGIRASLETLGATASIADHPRVRRLKDVQHLETSITARLPEGTGLLDAVAALHPTPAVGGVPREPALRWLASHEALDRGHYAAPIGWMDERGNGAFHVALRSVLIRPDSAWAYAGAGIVCGSDPDAEWREVNHKLRAIRAALTTREDTDATDAMVRRAP